MAATLPIALRNESEAEVEMRSGAAVVRYAGTRGVTWRIKYVDAGGRQVQETLGRAADGWSERKAKSELRKRLTDVERDGHRRLDSVTFAAFARNWLATYPAAKSLKRSTVEAYRHIIEGHLVPAFGPMKLDAMDVRGTRSGSSARRRRGRPSTSPATRTPSGSL